MDIKFAVMLRPQPLLMAKHSIALTLEFTHKQYTLTVRRVLSASQERQGNKTASFNFILWQNLKCISDKLHVTNLMIQKRLSNFLIP